jgi:hypothetical protein
MNTSSKGALVVAFCLLSGPGAEAQYRAPRQYFPKNFPAPTNTVNRPTTPARAATNSVSTATRQLRFQDLPLKSQFYFLSDTNRVQLWTKISATVAKNDKNGRTNTIRADIPIRKP